MATQLDRFVEVFDSRVAEKNRNRRVDQDDEGSATTEDFSGFSHFQSASKSSAEYGYSSDDDDEKEKKKEQTGENATAVAKGDEQESAKDAAQPQENPSATGSAAAAAAAAEIGEGTASADGSESDPTGVNLPTVESPNAPTSAALPAVADHVDGASADKGTTADSGKAIALEGDEASALGEDLDACSATGVAKDEEKKERKKVPMGMGLFKLGETDDQRQAKETARLETIRASYADVAADIARAVNDKRIHSRALQQVRNMIEELKKKLAELRDHMPTVNIHSVDLSNFSSCSTRASGGIIVMSFNLLLVRPGTTAASTEDAYESDSMASIVKGFMSIMCLSNRYCRVVIRVIHPPSPPPPLLSLCSRSLI